MECKGIRRGAHDLVAAVGRKHLKKLAVLLGRRPIEVEVSLDDLRIVSARDMYQLLERIGRHEIVRLQNANVLAARLVEAPVHRVAVSGVGLVDHDEARIALHVLADNRRARIGRTVIDADDLDVLERLRRSGIEALPKIALHVIDGNQKR